MCGTNGSQLWDLAFWAQALVETGLAEEEGNEEMIKGMMGWLDKAQIREDRPYMKEGYRHRTKGAWPFSTPEQSYTVGCFNRFEGYAEMWRRRLAIVLQRD
jgi:lanosterol synthase